MGGRWEPLLSLLVPQQHCAKQGCEGLITSICQSASNTNTYTKHHKGRTALSCISNPPETTVSQSRQLAEKLPLATQ